jgi:spore maturation protein CgeB
MTRVMMVASITLPSGDTPLLVERALRQLGCETSLVAVEEDLPLLEALRYDSVSQFDRRRFNRRVRREAEAFLPELLLVYDSNWGISPSTLESLRARHRCRVVLWEKNLNLWGEHQVSCFPFYDHVFCADSYPLEMLRKPSAGLRDVRFLGSCCDPDEHGRVQLSERDRQRFEADLSFVGGGRAPRRELFEALTDFRLKLWGWGWDRSEALAPFMVKETVFGLKKTKIYSATSICPNLQSGLYQVNGISERPLEVACCGRAPFSQPQPDLSRFLEPGEEVILFDNPGDLARKVADFLRRTDELERIGERARQRVLAEHTYQHRLRELLEVSLN